VAIRVVAAVSDHARGPLPWSTNPAGDGGYCLDEREQLLDVVAVGAGQAPGERDAAGIDDQVLL
jgi:hypothetical protein